MPGYRCTTLRGPLNAGVQKNDGRGKKTRFYCELNTQGGVVCPGSGG